MENFKVRNFVIIDILSAFALLYVVGMASGQTKENSDYTIDRYFKLLTDKDLSILDK